MTSRDANLREAKRIEGLVKLRTDLKGAILELPFVSDVRVALGETPSGRTVVAEVVLMRAGFEPNKAQEKIVSLASEIASVPLSSVRIIFVTSIE